MVYKNRVDHKRAGKAREHIKENGLKLEMNIKR